MTWTKLDVGSEPATSGKSPLRERVSFRAPANPALLIRELRTAVAGQNARALTVLC